MDGINAGDTAWVLMAAAMVMIMTPALGFFYGGLVRKKNVLSTLMHSFFTLCVVSVIWVLWGYTLAFGADKGGLIGSLEHFALRGIGPEAGPYAYNIPALAFIAFQMMFACIPPALIPVQFAERITFKTYLLFTVFWVTLV